LDNKVLKPGMPPIPDYFNLISYLLMICSGSLLIGGTAAVSWRNKATWNYL